jgi:hypothetical protein
MSKIGEISLIKLYSYIILSILTVTISCATSKKENIETGLIIKVTDPAGKPITAAKINVEIWPYEFYDLYSTDSKGRVYIKEEYLGNRAEVYKNNYFSEWVTIKSGTYVLKNAPQTFIEVGKFEGKPIRMDDKHIMTITYLGKYRLYSYDKENINEEANYDFPGWGYRTFNSVIGDTLWYAVIRDGIYIYDLSDPFSIVQIGHIPFEERLNNLAKKDSILVYESFKQGGGTFLHFCYFKTENNIEELTEVKTEYTDIFHSISGYLIKRNERGWTTVIDYRDPGNIDTVFSDLIFEGSRGNFQGDTLILKESVWMGNDFHGYIHHLIDFPDPESPELCGDIEDGASIRHIINDSTFICDYESNSRDFLLKRANLSGSLETIAVISEEDNCDFYWPPFFISGRKVWRLLEKTE